MLVSRGGEGNPEDWVWCPNGDRTYGQYGLEDAKSIAAQVDEKTRTKLSRSSSTGQNLSGKPTHRDLISVDFLVPASPRITAGCRSAYNGVTGHSVRFFLLRV
jgi:hypothetical protein